MKFCKTGLIACLLLLSMGVNAQQNFVEGYVVNNLGDTLRGLIDDKNWLGSPGEVRFRRQLNDQTITYTPADIQAFYLPSREYYQSKAVMYDASPVKLAYLGESPNPQWRKDTLFLRVETAGLVKLYFFQENNDKEHFFLEKNDGGAEELLNVRYYAYHEGVRKLAATLQYKSQLKHYLGDCNALKGKLYNAAYKLEAIRNLVKQYNLCQGSAVSNQDSSGQRDGIIKLGLLAGVHRTSLQFTSASTGFDELTSGMYRDALSGVGGISADIYIPRWHRQLLFHNELVYKPYFVTRVVEKQGALGSSYSKADTYFRVGYVQANLMFRYHRATFSKVRPFVQAGFILGKSVKASSLTRTETTYSSGATFRKEAPALAELGKLTSGFAGGLGITVGKFGLEARYERTTGLSVYNRLGATTHSSYVLASYTLR